MFYNVNMGTVPKAYGASQKSTAKVKGVQDAPKTTSFDTFDVSMALSDEQAKVKGLVGQISQSVRVRPTAQELDTLKAQVQDGTYKPNVSEIAARMMLLGEGL